MKIPKFVIKLITNKYVLYLVALMSALNVFGYMLLGNINAVITFVLIGFAMSFFSRNMIVVLAVPLILTNFFMAGIKIKEGLETMAKDTKDKKDKKPSSNTSVIYPIPPEATAESSTDATASATADATADTEATTSEEFETRQPLEYTDVKKKGKNTATRLDHGATVENAYDTLNKIIGGPGFSKMTDDTKRLMEQQQKLAQSMEQFGPMLDSIKPFLDKAQGLLGNMDIKGISEMVNKNKV